VGLSHNFDRTRGDTRGNIGAITGFGLVGGLAVVPRFPAGVASTPH
jgi:hypothetical protein